MITDQMIATKKVAARSTEKIGAALVVGGGIGGIQAALDLADSGFKVYLVERKPSIGGIMAQLDKTFPTNDCAMCILAPKLVSVARHPNITIISNSELEGLSGKAGNFVVTLKKQPRYVDIEKCTGCGICMQECPVRQVIYQQPEQEKIDLADKDHAVIKGILREYQSKKGNLMPILQEINRQYKYLPVALLRFIAQEIKIPLSRIFSIATFYNAFSLEPKGRHSIAVCRGTACHVRGSLQILERIEQELGISDGGTTDDLRFSLQTVRCIGCCSIAPAVRIDGDTYGNVRTSQILDMLRKYE
jgi:NADH:ubiquinone oxidoreductase subunit E